GGVRLVELAPVSDPARVPQAVVDALGQRETGVPSRPEVPDDPVSRVVDAVSGRDTLLVLDNCEHVLDTVAHLVDALLGRCPALRIMATSRESLGVVGESLFDVRPLDLPEPGAPAVAAAAAPAVRLFADRARAVRPASPSTTRRWTTSWRSAGDSTASRSPWNSRRRGCARCRSAKSAADWANG